MGLEANCRVLDSTVKKKLGLFKLTIWKTIGIRKKEVNFNAQCRHIIKKYNIIRLKKMGNTFPFTLVSIM